MPSEFRPTTPSDGPLLVALAQRLLGVAPDGPMFAAPQLHWKYWATWRGSSLARSHVLVRDGRIVAHAGVLPLTTSVRGQPLTLLHPFDWMSEPGAIGSGAALLQRLSKLADGLLIVGGSSTTQRMVGPLGFRAIGDVTRYVASVTSPSTPGAGCAATTFSPEVAEDVSVQRVAHPTHRDCKRAELPEPWLFFAQTPERLVDCQSCPAAPMAVYTARRTRSQHGEEDAPLGGFVLALAPGQARIAALWTVSPDSEAQELIVRLARAQAQKQPGVSQVVSMANTPVERKALLAAGFQLAGAVPMFVLARELDANARLSFQMLDGDLAFLHHGAPDPWL